MMNILNITTITELRGGDIQMHTIYSLLKAYPDLNQFILCPEDSDLAKKYAANDKGFITYKKRNKIFSAVKSIIKAVQQHKIDVVHIHDSSALSATLIASYFFSKNVKIVLSRKRDKKIKQNFLGKWKYGNSKILKILSVSKAVESIFYPIFSDRSKLITIYDAIDVKAFSSAQSLQKIHREFDWKDEVKIIGNISALENQKDLFTFIDVAKKVFEKSGNPQNYKFVIIGEGSKRAELTDYIQELNLQDKIFLLGFRKDIPELLPEFDIFLLTSISEGLPLTVYEAFATKVPVVATAAGGIPEVLKDGETGFLSPIKDSDKLANDILMLLEDPEKSQEITQKAFQMVSEKFDLPVMQKNYYEFYQSL